jgi:hypothetical protein
VSATDSFGVQPPSTVMKFRGFTTMTTARLREERHNEAVALLERVVERCLRVWVGLTPSSEPHGAPKGQPLQTNEGECTPQAVSSVRLVRSSMTTTDTGAATAASD